jgi:hypothetical protein
LFPLAIGTAAEFVDLASEFVTNLGDISLSKPLLFLVLGHEGACHLGLQFLFVGVVGSLDLDFLFLAIFRFSVATRSLWLATPTSPNSLLLILDLLVYSPPFTKVRETNLVR